MGKRRFTDDSYQREPWFKSLVSALIACKTEGDMSNFLRDIGTLSELQAWSERLEVAKLLVTGMSYRDVAAKTGASTTTVTRVAKFIENGEGGYRKILNAHRHHRTVHTTLEKMEGSMAETSEKSDPKTGNNRPDALLQKYLGKKD